MKVKEFIIVLFFAAIIAVLSAYIALRALHGGSLQTASASVKSVDPSIVADGQVHSQNEATLHFQAGGKLVALPFKEGDSVTTGQTIAQLDTYTLQKQLTQALNSYRSTRDSFDQSKTNQDNGLLHGTSQQTIQNGSQTEFVQPQTIGGDNSYNYLNDIAKRIVDQNQANLDNSVINVEIANYAFQMATLTSPFNGVLMHEDVTVANQNVTPATSFVVADPKSLIFKANIPASQIDFVHEGDVATIHLDGSNETLQGSVLKVYPQKQSLPTGDVYEVDIQSDMLNGNAKLQQSGSVVITTRTQADVTLVPSWIVLSHNYIWVLENNMPVLKKVTVGQTHGNETEVSGLNSNDKVILDPKGIAYKHYQLL
jgi:multidrug resistance efflux pump